MERRFPSLLTGYLLGQPERVATLLVQAQLSGRVTAPAELITRLRRMELAVRDTHGDRQTLQVIASGRRLLGDPEEIVAPEPAFKPEIAASA